MATPRLPALRLPSPPPARCTAAIRGRARATEDLEEKPTVEDLSVFSATTVPPRPAMQIRGFDPPPARVFAWHALELDAFKYLQIVASYGGCTGANNLDKNEEILSGRARQRHVDRRRWEAPDKLINLKELGQHLGSVGVFCRVWPLLNTESPVTVEQERITVKSVGIKKEFDADRVFGQEYAQGSLSDNFCAIIVLTEYGCLTAIIRKKEIVDVIVKAIKST
ncbi:Kinesin-like protein KIN-14O [Zea mays]|uniref:Kinesin-like protein KIN-14O n=2 Tax=Zea mays TaxID=4577 RepID=A0A8J8YTA9_MAIZE|nr:hypothetical protein ZEAMMB73_Zm00001d002886 [Zea mays]ONM15580.1 hypothetical protein ZEAMMB73_Zm00001d002887 [Zea mays]ONM15581.1 hypothetical protein ZEAMMB73_Zm00001d002887 [Zea mays]PWZ36493.1 Kinesin-like protein KIN-14O [Zea mays]PWZ41049.1 Kinesin-like protein KIN-14O [Zea mays]